MAIALYLSFQIRRSPNQTITVNSLQDSKNSEEARLSARQMSILRGMVEGKTNHDLATELGFSVSTVRHETMRIYQALSVSDRKEAAKKAIANGLA
jgi:DNA-binding NarL/FixJ family response regulator